MTAPAWPGLGFDPAPGSAAGVGALVETLSAAARRLEETHAALAAVAGPQAWDGDASRAFAAAMTELPAYLAGAHESLRRAGGVLVGWQEALDGLQVRARDLEGRAVAARADLGLAEEVERQARSHPDFALVGRMFPAEELLVAQARIDAAQVGLERAVRVVEGVRASLEDLLRSARSLRDEHLDEARRVADGVRRADDGLAPPEPAWFEQATGWVGENLDDIGDVAGMIAGISGALAFIPVLTPIAGPIALIAGGVALAADVGDMVRNDKWGDAEAWQDIGLDAVGLVPGVGVVRPLATAVGDGAQAAALTFRTVEGITPTVSAGAEMFARGAAAAGPDMAAALRQPGIVAKQLEPTVTAAVNRILPTLTATPGLTADPAVVANGIEIASRLNRGLDRASHVGDPADAEGFRPLDEWAPR